MASKIRKGWDAEAEYRSYSRRFGPLVLIVNYSCVSQCFDARIIVDGKACLYEFPKTPEFVGDDDFDNAMLKHFEAEARGTIKSWTK
jgi:hypothetical protein